MAVRADVQTGTIVVTAVPAAVARGRVGAVARDRAAAGVSGRGRAGRRVGRRGRRGGRHAGGGVTDRAAGVLPGGRAVPGELDGAVGTRVGTVRTRVGYRGGGARPRGAERPAVLGDPRERRAGQRVLVERLRERPALRDRRGHRAGLRHGRGRGPGRAGHRGGRRRRGRGTEELGGVSAAAARCGGCAPGSGAGSRGGAPIGRWSGPRRPSAAGLRGSAPRWCGSRSPCGGSWAPGPAAAAARCRRSGRCWMTVCASGPGRGGPLLDHGLRLRGRPGGAPAGCRATGRVLDVRTAFRRPGDQWLVGRDFFPVVGVGQVVPVGAWPVLVVAGPLGLALGLAQPRLQPHHFLVEIVGSVGGTDGPVRAGPGAGTCRGAMLRPGISWGCAPLLRVLRVLRDGQGRGAILARVRAGPVTGFGRGTVRRAALAGGRGAVPLGQRPLLRGGRPGRGRDRRHRGGHLVPGRSRGRHRGGNSRGPPLASRGRGRGSGSGQGPPGPWPDAGSGRAHARARSRRRRSGRRPGRGRPWRAGPCWGADRPGGRARSSLSGAAR